MRTILHVDMNAYFASVEQAANPMLKGKPVAVGGGTGGKRSIVAAASYEAKARGIKTAMPAWEAVKICPDLIIVGGDMTKYIYTSSAIMKMLQEFSPLVEVFSIDEAFLDITGTKDRFGGKIKVAQEIKRKIRERFRITCSIGIGPNKLLAKLAGELKKPDGLLELKNEDIPERIKDLPVSKLCGIGRRIEKRLNGLGIYTFLDLNRFKREEFVRLFGAACGEQLYLMGQGIDRSEVLGHNVCEAAKSMGHSYTLPNFTSDIGEVKRYLMKLSEQVGRRLRKGHYKGNVIHLTLGFGNFKFWGRQKKIADLIDDGYEIFKHAEKLIDNYLEQAPSPFRFVGISLSNLVRNIDQISLLGGKEQDKKVLRAMDEINNRFGDLKIERLAVLKTSLQNKTGMAPRGAFRKF